MIVAEPGFCPVTTPLLFTVATPVLFDDHEPPLVTVVVNVVLEPSHSVLEPEIVPELGVVHVTHLVPAPHCVVEVPLAQASESGAVVDE